MTPDHVNPLQWHQAIGFARQSCARIFRDGGEPANALDAFGIDSPREAIGWDKAVQLVAERLCRQQPTRRAA